MTNWLKLTDDQRRATIAEVEYITGIQAKAIEKDWWVTLTLRALFQGAYAQHIVFKGGTSLSKCWKLISRFSEDIDIALAPEAFEMKYEKYPSKSYVEKLKRTGCVFTSTILKEDLEAHFLRLGVSKDLILIQADPVPKNRPDTDPQTLHVKYKPLYDPNPYIADEVKIEVSVRSLKTPFSKAAIQSILSLENPSDAYAEEPLQIDAVEPHKTLLEKIFLLHEEFGKPDVSKIRSERMSRHLYDLSSMIDTDAEAKALRDEELCHEIIHHRKSYQRIGWVKYETLGYGTVSFIPPDAIMDLYRNDYKTMQEQMIYAGAPDFDQIIGRLKSLQDKLRAKSST
jgi:hypothetical protein